MQSGLPRFNSVIQRNKGKKPKLQLEEGMLNTLGLRLSFNPSNTDQGINIFLLALHIFGTTAFAIKQDKMNKKQVIKQFSKYVHQYKAKFWKKVDMTRFLSMRPLLMYPQWAEQNWVVLLPTKHWKLFREKAPSKILIGLQLIFTMKLRS